MLAGLIGAVAGVVGGLLLAPKSGRETREDIAQLAAEIIKKLKMQAADTRDRVKDIYGKISDEAMDKYNQVKNTVAGKVAALRTAGEEISKEKYSKVVEEVVADFKADFEGSKNGAVKLVNYLKKDWEKVKKALVEKEPTPRKTSGGEA